MDGIGGGRRSVVPTNDQTVGAQVELKARRLPGHLQRDAFVVLHPEGLVLHPLVAHRDSGSQLSVGSAEIVGVLHVVRDSGGRELAGPVAADAEAGEDELALGSLVAQHPL